MPHLLLSLAAAASAGTWGATATLYGPFAVSSPPIAPALAVNASGHSLVAWDATGDIRYAWRLAGQRWSRDVHVPQAYGQDVAVALGTDGTAAIGWVTVATEFTPAEVMVSICPPGAACPAGTSISVGGGAELDLGVAADGSVVLAWTDAAGVAFAEHPAGGAWTAPIHLGAGGAPSLDVNDGGDVVVAWDSGDSALPGVAATVRAAGAAAFEAPASLAAGGWGPEAGIDAAGGAWVGFVDGTSMAVVGRGVAGWGAEDLVSGPAQVASWPALAVDDAGEVAAVWQVYDAATGGTAVWASVNRGAWTAPQRLSARTEAPGWPAAAWSGDGARLAVAWTDDAAGRARTVILDATAGGTTWSKTSPGAASWGSTIAVDAGGPTVTVAWTPQSPANPNSATIVARANQ